MKIIIVGFQVEKDNSVYYCKLKNPTPLELKDKMLAAILVAKSEFISVRIIRRKDR
jgi:hypothetical protein